MSNTDEVMDPNELALQAANVDITGTSWLESSILVEKVKSLKEICLGNCRLLYGSERFKFYDIVICEDEDTKEFGAILICNQNNHTKLLRTETSDSPVKAVRILVDRLQKDTTKLFLKYTVGSQLEGQQGSTDKETGIYALWDSAIDKRIYGHDDDTTGLVRSWIDAPGGARRPPPRGPRYDAADGYEDGAQKRRVQEQTGRPVAPLNYDEDL